MAGRTDVKISVIVPVYNVEKELPRCIESLLTQTYSNFELLLINDGSSDGSPEIMERYAEKDSRIRTLHKKNSGVSSARNRGLEQAKGEYVCFVDADDAVAPQYMEWLYLALRQSGEAVAICRDVRVNDFEKEVPFKALPEKMPETERMDLRQYTFWDENGCLWCCRGMMKTESLRDIRFDEELSIGEDALFMAKALLKAGRYIYLPCGLYAYYNAGWLGAPSGDIQAKAVQRDNGMGKNLCTDPGAEETRGRKDGTNSRGTAGGGLRPCILPDGGQRPCRSGAASQDRADGARALAGGLARPEQQEA